MNVVLAASLLLVYGLDGRAVYINPEAVISIAPPKSRDELFSKDVECVISLADGKFISTKENCGELRARLRTGAE